MLFFNHNFGYSGRKYFRISLEVFCQLKHSLMDINHGNSKILNATRSLISCNTISEKWLKAEYYLQKFWIRCGHCDVTICKTYKKLNVSQIQKRIPLHTQKFSPSDLAFKWSAWPLFSSPQMNKYVILQSPITWVIPKK